MSRKYINYHLDIDDGCTTEEAAKIYQNALAALPAEVADFLVNNDSFCWTELEKDMKFVSESFPQILFSVYATEGMEDDEPWILYFRDGHVQRGGWSYEAFDPSRLVAIN